MPTAEDFGRSIAGMTAREFEKNEALNPLSSTITNLLQGIEILYQIKGRLGLEDRPPLKVDPRPGALIPGCGQAVEVIDRTETVGREPSINEMVLLIREKTLMVRDELAAISKFVHGL